MALSAREIATIAFALFLIALSPAISGASDASLISEQEFSGRVWANRSALAFSSMVRAQDLIAFAGDGTNADIAEKETKSLKPQVSKVELRWVTETAFDIRVDGRTARLEFKLMETDFVFVQNKKIRLESFKTIYNYRSEVEIALAQAVKTSLLRILIPEARAANSYRPLSLRISTLLVAATRARYLTRFVNASMPIEDQIVRPEILDATTLQRVASRGRVQTLDMSEFDFTCREGQLEAVTYQAHRHTLATGESQPLAQTKLELIRNASGGFRLQLTQHARNLLRFQQQQLPPMPYGTKFLETDQQGRFLDRNGRLPAQSYQQSVLVNQYFCEGSGGLAGTLICGTRVNRTYQKPTLYETSPFLNFPKLAQTCCAKSGCEASVKLAKRELKRQLTTDPRGAKSRAMQ